MNTDYNKSPHREHTKKQPIGNSIHERVIKAVADARDEDPVQMRPPLYDVIDPDALDTLFESNGIAVEFVWQKCQIKIDENRTVHVTELE